MFVEGADVLVIVVAMDELHVREMERRRAKDEAAGTADAKTRVTEPSPKISQITSFANGMEVVLQQWREGDERREANRCAPDGPGSREQAVLKENKFIGEMRMRIMTLHIYVDQHRLSRLTLPAGGGSQHAQLLNNGMQPVPEGYTIMPPSEGIFVMRSSLEGRFLSLSRPFAVKRVPAARATPWLRQREMVEVELSAPESWHRDEALSKGNGWPPNVIGEREAQLQENGVHININDFEALQVYEECGQLPEAENAVGVDKCDELCKKVWRAYLQTIGIEF